MNLTKLEGILIAVVLGLVALGIFDLVARHRGAAACVAGDKATVATAAVHNADVHAAGTIATAKEDQHHDDALKAPPAPLPVIAVVDGLQPPAHAACPSPVPHAGPAAGPSQPGADAGDRSEGGGLRAAQESAFVDALNRYRQRAVQRAHDSDVEVADRNRLLEINDSVCRGKSPPAS